MKTFTWALAITLLVFTSACGSNGMIEGTDAGNPILNGGPGPGAPVMGTDTQPGATDLTGLGWLVTAACLKLRDCFPNGVVLTECTQAAAALPATSEWWGISAEGYLTMGDMIEADDTGAIQPSAQQMGLCSFDVGQLACDSAAVQDAYSAAEPAVFSRIGSIFSQTPSCAIETPGRVVNPRADFGGTLPEEG